MLHLGREASTFVGTALNDPRISLTREGSKHPLGDGPDVDAMDAVVAVENFIIWPDSATAKDPETRRPLASPLLVCELRGLRRTGKNTWKSIVHTVETGAIWDVPDDVKDTLTK